MTSRNSRALSWFAIISAYVMAFMAAYFLFPVLTILIGNLLTFPIGIGMLKVMVADIAATFVIFTFSVIFNNSSFYDPYWSLVPPVIVLYLIKLFPGGNCLRQYTILILVSFWSIRLTVNWFRSWKGISHQDWRYSYMQEKTGRLYWPVSLMGIHMMPTIFVFSGCLPLWYALSACESMNIYDMIAALFTLTAIILEWIADEQLIQFRKQGSAGYMKSGLWAISRHPNYLGEICFWTGLFMFAMSSSAFRSPAGLWTILGPISMIILFTGISIPLMEKRNLERRPGYEEYIKKVPVLIPGLKSKRK